MLLEQTQKNLQYFQERFSNFFDVKEYLRIKSCFKEETVITKIVYTDSDFNMVTIYCYIDEDDIFHIEDENGNSYIDELRLNHFKDEDLIHFIKTGETKFYEINKVLGLKVYCRKNDNQKYYKVSFCDCDGKSILSFKPKDDKQCNKVDDLWYFLSSIGSKNEFIDYLSCFGKIKEISKPSEASFSYKLNDFYFTFELDLEKAFTNNFYFVEK